MDMNMIMANKRMGGDKLLDKERDNNVPNRIIDQIQEMSQ